MRNNPSRTKSIAVRLISAAVLWVALMLMVGGLLLSNLFREPIEQSFHQRLGFLLDSLITATDLTSDGRAIQRQGLGEPRFLRQFSGWYWQVVRLNDGKIINQSPSMWDFEIPVNDHASMLSENTPELSYIMAGPLGQNLQVAAKRITTENAPGAYIFIVATDRGDLVAAIESFNMTLIWSLGVLGIGLIIAVFIQVRFGLLPLQRIRSALMDIREGRAERLSGDFPEEIRPLANELNGLLDHTADVLSRARSHVGNLAHVLKTPLAVLTNEGQKLSAKKATLVAEQTALMHRHVDHYLARAGVIGQAPLLRAQIELLPVIKSIIRTLKKIHAVPDNLIAVEVEERLAFRGEENDLEEMLGNLMDNACKWACSRINLRVETLSGTGGLRICIIIDDDGPGIGPELRKEIFNRGRRADETKPGDGLGLSIVREISTLYGGQVELGDAPNGGLRAILTLPGARIKEEIRQE